MQRNYYQNQSDDYQNENDFQSQEEYYPSDAYDAWDIDEPEEGEDDPFEGWGND